MNWTIYIIGAVLWFGMLLWFLRQMGDSWWEDIRSAFWISLVWPVVLVLILVNWYGNVRDEKN